jgi:hypothetical protein
VVGNHGVLLLIAKQIGSCPPYTPGGVRKVPKLGDLGASQVPKLGGLRGWDCCYNVSRIELIIYKIRERRGVAINMLKSYEVTIEEDRIKWLGEKPKVGVFRAIIVVEESNSIPKRTTPVHLKGKGRTLGDIVSPIVDEEDWECLK